MGLIFHTCSCKFCAIFSGDKQGISLNIKDLDMMGLPGISWKYAGIFEKIFLDGE